MSTNTQPPAFSRTGFAPAILAVIVLLAGLALLGGSWYLYVRYAVSILAIIVCVFAVQAKQYWWLIGLVPIAVVWNPVFPITLDDIVFRVLHLVAVVVFVAAGIRIKVPTSAR